MAVAATMAKGKKWAMVRMIDDENARPLLGTCVCHCCCVYNLIATSDKIGAISLIAVALNSNLKH